MIDGNWAVPRSLAATEGISVDFCSSGYLDVSVHQVYLPTLCIQIRIANKLAGFPHSDIPGSKSVCRLPEAYRRLRRPSSPSAAKAFTRCACSLDHITQPVGWATWNVFRRYFFTRGRRPPRRTSSPGGFGRWMRSTPLATMPLPPRPEAKHFVAKTHSFTDAIGCMSAGRESPPEGSRDPSPKRQLGVCRAYPDRPEGHSELADTRLHQLRNFKTARRAGPPMGCPRLARSHAQGVRSSLNFVRCLLCQRSSVLTAWRARRPHLRQASRSSSP